MKPDVLVVGAGIIGLSVARYLQSHGFDVVVVDQGKAASEASWAGAGMLAPYGEALPNQYWSSLAHQSLNQYPSWVAQLSALSGESIDFQICGSERIEQGAVTSFPDEAVVDPRDVCRALQYGLDIREGVHITAVSDSDARAVVVAAGAWSGGIAGLPATVPVKGWLIAYDMPPGSLGPIRRSGHTYLLQRTGGLTIAGSTEEYVGFDRSFDPEAVADLERRASALWPELAGKRPVDVWCGFRPGTPTGIPEVGRLPGTRIWLAYGHYRNGILLAPVTAELIGQSIIASFETGSPAPAVRP